MVVLNPLSPTPHTHTFNLTHYESGETIRYSWGVFPLRPLRSQKWVKRYECAVNEKTVGPTV